MHPNLFGCGEVGAEHLEKETPHNHNEGDSMKADIDSGMKRLEAFEKKIDSILKLQKGYSFGADGSGSNPIDFFSVTLGNAIRFYKMGQKLEHEWGFHPKMLCYFSSIIEAVKGFETYCGDTVRIRTERIEDIDERIQHRAKKYLNKDLPICKIKQDYEFELYLFPEKTFSFQAIDRCKDAFNFLDIDIVKLSGKNWNSLYKIIKYRNDISHRPDLFVSKFTLKGDTCFEQLVENCIMVILDIVLKIESEVNRLYGMIDRKIPKRYYQRLWDNYCDCSKQRIATDEIGYFK